MLLNQCPHNLDLLQWICGMPDKVHGFCGIGKRHKIEVEDEVTAYLEYPGGCTGLFVTTTGEAPGTNRFEIAGDKGKLVYENNVITYAATRSPATEFLKTSLESFARPRGSGDPIRGGHGGQHAEVLRILRRHPDRGGADRAGRGRHPLRRAGQRHALLVADRAAGRAAAGRRGLRGKAARADRESRPLSKKTQSRQNGYEQSFNGKYEFQGSLVAGLRMMRTLYSRTYRRIRMSKQILV